MYVNDSHTQTSEVRTEDTGPGEHPRETGNAPGTPPGNAPGTPPGNAPGTPPGNAPGTPVVKTLGSPAGNAATTTVATGNADPATEVFSYWQRVMGRTDALLSAERRAVIGTAFDLGYDIPSCREAIDGCRRSAFHMGEMDRSKVFNDVVDIFKDASTIDKHRQRVRAAVAPALGTGSGPAAPTAPLPGIQRAGPPPAPSAQTAAGAGAAAATFKKGLPGG